MSAAYELSMQAAGSPSKNVEPEPSDSQNVNNPTNEDPYFKNPVQTTVTEDKVEMPQFEEVCQMYEQYLPKLEMNAPKRWTQLLTVLQKFDDNQSMANNENIDTLLVFAGLFSAILTAFIVEAYKLLQRDTSVDSVQILIQISQQLNSFATYPGYINSTYIPAGPPPFTPALSSLWVNALWFAALIFSLVTVSLGMLVKQWLREYQSNPRVSPEEHRRVRLFRIRGLRKYGVLEIASFLPLLLQIALALFLVGLALFVLNVHWSIGCFVLSLVTIWFVFLGVTTLLPIFSPSCPYKTPFLKSAFFHCRQMLESLYVKAGLMLSKPMAQPGIVPSERRLFVEETDVAQNLALDHEVQLDARDTFRDIKVWEMVTCCIDPDSPLESLEALVAIVEKKHGSPVGPSSNLQACFDEEEWRRLLQSMIMCIRKRFIGAYNTGYQLGTTDIKVLLILRVASTVGGYWLRDMAKSLIEGAFCIPWTCDSLRNLISWRLGFPEAGLSMCIGCDERSFMAKTSHLLDTAAYWASGRSKIPIYNALELCRTVFIFSAQQPQDDREAMKSEILNLTYILADVLTAIPTPSKIWLDDAFWCHCVLNMGMRLHKQIPGIISESLFEALHVHSVKMFDTATSRPRRFRSTLRMGPGDRSQTPVGPNGGIDWKKVLEDYVEVEVRPRGGYDVQWEYWRTRFSCKHRMEFILNFETRWARDIREAVEASQFPPFPGNVS